MLFKPAPNGSHEEVSSIFKYLNYLRKPCFTCRLDFRLSSAPSDGSELHRVDDLVRLHLAGIHELAAVGRHVLDERGFRKVGDEVFAVLKLIA
jgi:hypothetical protein